MQKRFLELFEGLRHRQVRRLLVVALLAGLGIAKTDDTAAQQTSGTSAEQLQNLTPEKFQELQTLSPEERQKLLQQQQHAATQQQPEQPLVLTPAPRPTQDQSKASELERVLSQRVGQDVRQFGYDQFGVGASVAIPQTGAIGDDYVLGPGDEIDVSLRGQENMTVVAVVDRNGQVTLARLNPITAAGRTLGDFRRDLLAAVHRTYTGTEAYASVDKLRQVNVLVTGEVENPGTRILTALSSPLDAILLSGGVKRNGSLRNIKLIREDVETSLDLYKVLTQQGSARLTNLRDGDRIFVPPIGATVVVAGTVRRPAIYELPAGRRAISVRDLLALATGLTVPGVYTASVTRLLPNGKLEFTDVSNSPSALVHDGEALLLRAAVNISLGRVTLEGAIRAPGAFALDRYSTLHDLLPSAEALEPGAYVLFGVIDRTDPQTLERVALPFSPLRVIQGRENLTLISDDSVHILTRIGMRALADRFGTQAKPSDHPNAGGSGASRATPSAGGPGSAPPSGVSGSGQIAPNADRCPIAGAVTNQESSTEEAGSAGCAVEGTDLGGYTSSEGSFFGYALSDYRISITGAVHDPGVYLVAPGTTLAEAIVAANGLASDVDARSFELTTTSIDNQTGTSSTSRREYPANPTEFASIVLRPQDEIAFRHVYSDNDGATVTIAGEVRYPGTYGILREERLSSVLKRAGGLTPAAFPMGTVFLRKSTAQLEQAGFMRATAELRSELFGSFARPPSASSTSAPLSGDTIVALEGLLTQLQTQPALGRISIIADPALLAADPLRDPVLEHGDSIVVPKRPNTVTVEGEVRQPGSYVYRPNLRAQDYLSQAAGLTAFADGSLTFVVLPDGSAEDLDRSWLPFGDRSIPPGSVIVVPRDIAPFSWNQFLNNASQIFSQLAIAGASLAVISANK